MTTSDDPLTPEHVSRLTTLALTSDLEYWARQASVDGHVGLNDLVHVLDLIRETSSGPTTSTRRNDAPAPR